MINLLPSTERENIYSNLFKKQVNTFGLFIALIFFGGAIFILNTYVFLKIQTRDLNKSINLEEVKTETQEAIVFESEVSKLNEILFTYKKFREEKQSVLNIFLKIKDIIPEGTTINSFIFDSDTKKVNLSGTANSRDIVVAMENNLKSSDFFEKIDSPLSNFLNKSDSKFNFTFYLKK